MLSERLLLASETDTLSDQKMWHLTATCHLMLPVAMEMRFTYFQFYIISLIFSLPDSFTLQIHI